MVVELAILHPRDELTSVQGKQWGRQDNKEVKEPINLPRNYPVWGAFDQENDSFAVYGDGVRVLLLELRASQSIEHFLRWVYLFYNKYAFLTI